MSRRAWRIGALVLAACVGLGVAVWASLRTIGFGLAVVVVTNVGSERVARTAL